MKPKTIILISIILLNTIAVFGQNEEFNLIKLDSTWGQEVIRFPARNINYVGVGEIRFPPEGWIKPEHTFFWSYTYAWSINLNRKVTTKELASNLVKYFDSLNKVPLNNKTDKRKATATIIKTNKKKSTAFFTGKVTTYDRFATNKRFVLNVKIESNYCKKTQKTVIIFKFSPKEFSHDVWKTMNKIKLIDAFCD